MNWVAEPDPGPDEFCETVLVSLDEFRRHLRTGQLTDVDLGYLALDHLGLLGGDGSGGRRRAVERSPQSPAPG